MSCAPQVQTDEERQWWFFTFGSGHTLRGESLLTCFTKIFGTHDEARAEMVKVRGTKWSAQYESAKKAGVDEWRLIEIPFEQLKPEPAPPPVVFYVVNVDDSDAPISTYGQFDEEVRDADGVMRTPEEQARKIAKALGWERDGRFAVQRVERTTCAVYGPHGEERHS